MCKGETGFNVIFILYFNSDYGYNFLIIFKCFRILEEGMDRISDFGGFLDYLLEFFDNLKLSCFLKLRFFREGV